MQFSNTQIDIHLYSDFSTFLVVFFTYKILYFLSTSILCAIEDRKTHIVKLKIDYAIILVVKKSYDSDKSQKREKLKSNFYLSLELC